MAVGQALAATPTPPNTTAPADDKRAARVASQLADELAQICPLADADVMPIRSFVTKYRNEFEALCSK